MAILRVILKIDREVLHGVGADGVGVKPCSELHLFAIVL